MKKFLIWLLTLAVVCVLAGCKAPQADDGIAGKGFMYEHDGFGGAFTINLHEDGTFQYYEGFLSSYIGMGSWSLSDDGILTLKEEHGYDFVHLFRVEDGKLYFIEEGSDNFIYVKLKDGACFKEYDASSKIPIAQPQ